MRVVLLEFNLVFCDGVAFAVEDEESRTGRAIVDRADEGLVRLVRLSQVLAELVR
jgi:hypothetical protein